MQEPVTKATSKKLEKAPNLVPVVPPATPVANVAEHDAEESFTGGPCAA